MRKPLGLLAALVLLAAACQGRGQNTVNVYSPDSKPPSLVSSVTQFSLNLAPEVKGSVTTVQYFLNDNAIGTSTSEGFVLNFDTRTVPDGVHNLKALGNPGQGDVELLNVSIYVQNGNGTTPASAAAAPGPGAAYKGSRR
jgi:hypothetical protein